MQEETTMFRRNQPRRNAALALSVLLLALTLLGGCGSSSNQALEEPDVSGSPEYEQSGQSPAPGFGKDGLEMGDKVSDEAATLPAGGSSDPFRRYGENVKLVYTAQLNLQTTDYEKAEKDLTALLEGMGGYFEYSYVDRGGYYSDGANMSGSYTVRIPSEKYELFLTAVGNTCHVVSINRSVTDIGMEYFDAETRLNTLRTKLDRLTALLEKADALSDIIELENSIANTQYEIDWHTSTLNRYDSLVGYATVNISMTQVERLSGGVDDAEGFFPSLLRSLKEGLGHFGDSLQGIALWIAYNLVALLILLGLLILGTKWFRRHRPDRALSLRGWNEDRKAHRAAKIAKKEQSKTEDQ